MPQKRKPARAVLHVSPQTDNPANDDATRQAIRASRINPRFLVTSQRRPDALPADDWARSVQIVTPEHRRTWGMVDYASPPSQSGIDAAVTKTLKRIGKSFDDKVDPLDAGHVVLDEVRLDTAATAAELFRRLPPEMRGKISAYVVGGPNVNYNNPAFKEAKLLAAMRQAGVSPVMETYGSPGAGEKQARGVAHNYRMLVKAGLSPSLSVGGLDRFNNPGRETWGAGDWQGNNQMAAWVRSLRRQLPNAPIGVWPAGTKRQPIAAGRMSRLLREVNRKG